MRINNSGHYEYCRWANKSNRTQEPHISEVQPLEYFRHHVKPIRQQLIHGHRPAGCAECAVMEQHGKVSGREKQLLKIGVRREHFDKSLASSPWSPIFASEECDQTPQDWQIDLGNYCNSACVFCSPHSSSRLAQEWQRIGIISDTPSTDWTNDQRLVEKLIHALTQCTHLRYLHFIGGETLITPAFAKILQRLIQSNLHHKATIGFTTNLTVWDTEIIKLLTKFQSVHLGVSIECLHTVNDYVRWPSEIGTITHNLNQWLTLAQSQNWLVQLRVTPTVFTIGRLLTVHDFAWQHKLAVESCNFLQEPACMRPSVLPKAYRMPIVNSMEAWLSQHTVSGSTVVNIRDPNHAHLQNAQDLQSYVNYLRDAPDESERLPELIEFIKRLEASRGNSVLDYLPEYEQLFRTFGY